MPVIYMSILVPSLFVFYGTSAVGKNGFGCLYQILIMKAEKISQNIVNA